MNCHAWLSVTIEIYPCDALFHQAGLALASTAKEVIKLALDRDLKDIGASCIPEEINRGKVDSITGPMVLMVTKVNLHMKMSHLIHTTFR